MRGASAGSRSVEKLDQIVGYALGWQGVERRGTEWTHAEVEHSVVSGLRPETGLTHE